MRIGQNIAALNTYRQLNNNGVQTNKSLEKLSSGLRINKAGDDAAGLAISEKMRGQIRGLDQAARNSQDGISMIQTAEGSLSETHSILQRMKELATQSANDTNTTSDRQEIQKEINQLTSEINRIGNTTEFNTQKLLDGGSSNNGVNIGTLQDNGVAATGAKVSGLQAVNFSNIPAAATATDDLTITVGDYGGNEVAFAVDGETFTILWDASAGGNANATEADKRNALVDILKNNLSATWENAAGDSLTVKLGDVANISISDAGVLTIQNKMAGSTGAVQDLKVTADGAFDDLVGLTDGIDYIANGTVVQEAVLVGNKSMAGTDMMKASDWAGKSFTVNFNGRETTVTLAQELTGHDFENDEVTAANLVLSFNAAFDAVFGSGAVTASIAVDPNDNTGSTKKYFQFETDSTKPANTDEGDVALGVKPSFSISGDNLSNILGSVAAAGAEVGGTFISKFQIGANQGQSFQIDISDMRAQALKISGTGAGLIQGEISGAKFAEVKGTTNGTDAVGTEYALDVSSFDTATAAIKVLDNAIQSVSAQRSQLGAYSNRLEHTVTNLGTSIENLTAAESRIRDVDMAKEMMEFTKNNILSQAAQAMLAQANQQPQGVLQLLR